MLNLGNEVVLIQNLTPEIRVADIYATYSKAGEINKIVLGQGQALVFFADEDDAESSLVYNTIGDVDVDVEQTSLREIDEVIEEVDYAKQRSDEAFEDKERDDDVEILQPVREEIHVQEQQQQQHQHQEVVEHIEVKKQEEEEEEEEKRVEHVDVPAPVHAVEIKEELTQEIIDAPHSEIVHAQQISSEGVIHEVKDHQEVVASALEVKDIEEAIIAHIEKTAEVIQEVTTPVLTEQSTAAEEEVHSTVEHTPAPPSPVQTKMTFIETASSLAVLQASPSHAASALTPSSTSVTPCQVEPVTPPSSIASCPFSGQSTATQCPFSGATTASTAAATTPSGCPFSSSASSCSTTTTTSATPQIDSVQLLKALKNASLPERSRLPTNDVFNQIKSSNFLLGLAAFLVLFTFYSNVL